MSLPQAERRNEQLVWMSAGNNLPTYTAESSSELSIEQAGAAIAAGRTAYAADDLRALAGKRSRCCAELRPQHSGEPGVVIRKVDMVLS